MGARDDAVAAWLAPTRALIADAVARGVPTLGVCLGHQLAAVALGGSVERNPSGRTIGPVPVRLSEAAASDPLLGGFDGLAAIHYNDDVVTVVPEGATVLATLPDGRPQAIRFGPRAWGVQFHPETSPEVFGAWLRWDSPDGLTPEQEALLDEVQAARDDTAGGVAALRGAVRGSGRGGCRGATCVSRHLLSGLLQHRRSIASGGSRTPAVDPAATENAMSASASAQSRERVVILGAAGRDFHDFNLMYRDDPGVEVVAFTATQIPDIAGRRYPPSWPGRFYPHGIPIVDEAELERSSRASTSTRWCSPTPTSPTPRSCTSARGSSRAGADFVVAGHAPHDAALAPTGRRRDRGAHGRGQEPDHPLRRAAAAGPWGCGSSRCATRCRTATSPRRRASGSRRPRTSCGTSAPSRSARSTSRTSRPASSSTPGVDYAQILREAEAEADVVLWDGGNNDLPFYVPDLHLVLADPLRPGDEAGYHPGEANVRHGRRRHHRQVRLRAARGHRGGRGVGAAPSTPAPRCSAATAR